MADEWIQGAIEKWKADHLQETGQAATEGEVIAFADGLSRAYAYRTPEQRKQMARNLLDELGLPQELGRVQMIADILKIWLGSPAPEEKRVKSTEELQKELEHLQFAADNKGVEVNQSRPIK